MASLGVSRRKTDRTKRPSPTATTTTRSGDDALLLVLEHQEHHHHHRKEEDAGHLLHHQQQSFIGYDHHHPYHANCTSLLPQGGGQDVNNNKYDKSRTTMKKRGGGQQGRKDHRLSLLFLCLMLLPTAISFILAYCQIGLFPISEVFSTGPIVFASGDDQQQQQRESSHSSEEGEGGGHDIISFTVVDEAEQHIHHNVASSASDYNTTSRNIPPDNDDFLYHVSVVILTFKKHDALAKLLPTVISQKGVTLEIIIVDNGCKPATQQVVQDAFNMTLNGTQQQQDDDGVRRSTWKYEYVQLCHNPGYAIGNNEGVKHSSNATKWVLLLNDDITLKDDDFIHNMVRLGDSHRETAAAVGCVLTNTKGDELIEAGNIVWSDGSAASFGRGRKDLSAPEFSYPKPVDYVSGACLMVDKSVFLKYGGFDHENFANYYEDTDLQMHIQHDLGKEVWVQPLSVALHEEHGSFGNKESLELMKKSHKIFFKKWREQLQKYHLPPPFHRPKIEQELKFLRAGDIRGRKSDKASILYIDAHIPNRQLGSGFGRAIDNLSILASLRHRVTVAALKPRRDKFCNANCIGEIRDLGIEVVTNDLMSFYAPTKSRAQLYDVVIVSRPITFLYTYRHLKEVFRKNPFALIYDSEALTYRRDEILTRLVEEDGIKFPGMEFVKSQREGTIFSKKQEAAMLSMSDYAVTVSVQETELAKEYVPNGAVETIGHIMDLNSVTTNSFSQRSGILFLASFRDEMYYNGDAIWYFLDRIYPLVLQEQQNTTEEGELIRLTIAGRGIPKQMRDFVKSNPTLARHVTFLESPENIDDLMEDTRLFIAPHQYGSGIQYKVRHVIYHGVIFSLWMCSISLLSFAS
jgi:Predicted glycosyltransferases